MPNEHSVHATSGVIAKQGNVEYTDDACSSLEHTRSDDVVIDWSTFTIVSAKSDQQVNICSFAVRCDRMWPSTQ